MLIDVARGLARRLLPAAVRKPVADRVYRSIDQGRNLVQRLRVWRARLGSAGRATPSTAAAPAASSRPRRHLVRRLRSIVTNLPGRVRALATRAVRAWILANLPLLWARRALSARERLRLAVLQRLLNVIDTRFTRQFRALLASALPPARRREGTLRLVAAIGTLGPGGAERQLVNTLVGLKAVCDIDIEVIAMYLDQDWQRFFLPTLEAAGIAVSLVGRDVEPGLMTTDLHPAAPRLETALARHLPAELTHVASYARLFLDRQPDIVHLWLDEVNVKAGLAAALTGVSRIVLSMRSVNPTHFVFYQPYMKAGYQVLLERAQVLALNNSQVGAEDYASWLGLDPGGITVIRNGVDFDQIATAPSTGGRGREYRTSHGIPAGAFVMGGVMRFSEEKRPLLWLEAAELVASRCPDAHYLLVGDGVQRPLVEARIAQSAFADRMHLVGHESKPYDSIAAMNVLFLSSVFEGSPNVLIEAQALGVPVVSTPAGGAVEALDDGRTGWIARSGSAREAADRIIDLAGNPALAAQAGDLAPDFVRARFGMRRMIDETAAAYGGVPARRADSMRDERRD